MNGASYIYTPAPRRGRGVYCFTSVLPSIQDIFRRIFLSNYWWQKSHIWSQASYRYSISWPRLTTLVVIGTDCAGSSVGNIFFSYLAILASSFKIVLAKLELHLPKLIAAISVTIDGRNLIFGHKLHIGTPYRGKRFWTHQIPTSCLPT
jgi:hypothetical protein